MTFFKFSRPTRKSTPAVATSMSLDSWYHQSSTQPTRLVQKVEMCTALCAGEDAWGLRLGTNHYHTLLRVSLVPTRNGTISNASADKLLIERILSTCGAYHSVIRISETFPDSGTLFHPDVHDRVCISNGPAPTKLARHDHLVVERTLTFGDRSSGPRLTLAQLGQILTLVSRSTKLVCDGGDCRFQSRAFVFTCMAALAPSIPPRKGVGASPRTPGPIVDDSVLELSAEAFLGQVPWLMRDKASIEALELIGALKDEARGKARARLYH